VSEEIRIERRGEVELLTIDRPEARNALTHQTYAELERAVRATTARCMVITGERNHQGIGNHLIESSIDESRTDGSIECRERLGGLLRYYCRAA
jgi:1,4-dihydroxy-2-naphthoyl-CoA synthase